jgi:hypothetical protein
MGQTIEELYFETLPTNPIGMGRRQAPNSTSPERCRPAKLTKSMT